MPNFLSCAEAAKVAQCSEITIRRAVRSGELVAYRPGKGYSIDLDDLTKWVKSHKVEPAKMKKTGV